MSAQFDRKATQIDNQVIKKSGFRFPEINFKNPIVITVLVILALVAIKLLGIGLAIYNMMSHPRPPATVSTFTAKQEEWQSTLGAVATLASPEGAVLKAEMAGTLREILFKSGQDVKKGDLLLVIEAEAERAAAKLSKLNYERAKQLRTQNVNTQNDLDLAEANYAQAQAALDKKEIRAPFDGKVGLTQAFVGQYIKVGDPLVAIESQKVINADFGVPQQLLPQLKVGEVVDLTVDAYPDEIFKGKLEGIDPRVTDVTLNVSVRAVFENPEGKLLSGMFGAVKVQLPDVKKVLVLPATAVVYSAYGNSVYVVKEEPDAKTQAKSKIARQQFVKLGETKGDFIAILDGLKEGDEVVSAGQMKLRNGAAVRVDNSLVPEFSLTPSPQES